MHSPPRPTPALLVASKPAQAPVLASPSRLARQLVTEEVAIWELVRKLDLRFHNHVRGPLTAVDIVVVAADAGLVRAARPLAVAAVVRAVARSICGQFQSCHESLFAVRFSLTGVGGNADGCVGAEERNRNGVKSLELHFDFLEVWVAQGLFTRSSWIEIDVWKCFG